MDRVADVLAWQVPADPQGTLRSRAQALLLTRIEALFARAAPPELGAEFRALVAALPAARRRRLLSAPELWGRVLQDLEADTDLFLDAARAEGGLGGAWTALGEPLSFASRLARLPQGAVIDGESPFATARIPHVIERFAPYSAEEIRDIVARLRAAGRALTTLCPEASDLVAAFSRTVVIRRDPDAPDRYQSESTEGFLGRVLLCNPHLASVETSDLMESLVHESIHSYLSTVELFSPFIPDRAAAEGLELVSPWTGAVLDGQRFVHATLVWFGLGCFWDRAAAARWPGAVERRDRARAGFRPPDLERALAALAPVLSAPARVLLAGLSAQSW